ncbi:response regulator transcription factor [Clostridium sp. 'deep sea']|uniref:response regulator transcription factor n=1 Tax=Clostridium sp. 'deep sea' TaxID=2779445 RepID=UPI0018969501|nr:response regulator transcription factor [Clostridium sp. 'deep sea']QOR34043.1 response regulator transcription factor [Clostridium sp. 'deep sea']
MKDYKILIIDDEIDICELLKLYLENAGYQVEYCHTGEQALEYAQSFNPDLIILDVLLPDTTGIKLCPELRTIVSCPIIFLSCKKQEHEKISGLEAGGDDYISKPFSPRELVARIKANLRRENIATARNRSVLQENIKLPSMTINRNNHTVDINGEVVPLSVKEFELLVFLASSPNKIFSVEEIYDEIWGDAGVGDIRTVMVHIRNVRKKIEKNPARPRHIINVRGAGYMLKLN